MHLLQSKKTKQKRTKLNIPVYAKKDSLLKSLSMFWCTLCLTTWCFIYQWNIFPNEGKDDPKNKQTKKNNPSPSSLTGPPEILLHLFLCLNSTLSSKDAYWRRQTLTGHKSFRSQRAMMDLRRSGKKKKRKKPSTIPPLCKVASASCFKRFHSPSRSAPEWNNVT